MSQFTNVTVIKQANIYFAGNVTSRTIIFADGSKKTLGIMQPGDYEFNTSEKERMEILSGELEFLPDGSTDWESISGGQSFEIEGNSSFQMKVKSLTDYCCSFSK
jgi:purine/pyrimidine-nucleoside phosphorylase